MPPPSILDGYPPSDAYDEIVDIRVGSNDDARNFKVCKGLLCFYSAFFCAALKGPFEEANHGKIELPSQDPHTFATFQYWLYTKRLPALEDSEDNKWTKLFQLWIFGDAHAIPLLQNQTLDLIMKTVLARWALPSSQIRLVYDNTMASSPLRRFLIDLIGRTNSVGTFFEKHFAQSEWQRDELMDLLRTAWHVSSVATKDEVAKWDTCQYHVHEEGVTCKKGRKISSKAPSDARSHVSQPCDVVDL